jgi:hypothetical protein
MRHDAVSFTTYNQHTPSHSQSKIATQRHSLTQHSDTQMIVAPSHITIVNIIEGHLADSCPNFATIQNSFQVCFGAPMGAFLSITLDAAPGALQHFPWHHTWTYNLAQHSRNSWVHILAHLFGSASLDTTLGGSLCTTHVQVLGEHTTTRPLAQYLVYHLTPHLVYHWVNTSWRVPWHQTWCIIGKKHHGMSLGTTRGASIGGTRHGASLGTSQHRCKSWMNSSWRVPQTTLGAPLLKTQSTANARLPC